jgi:hypothetical protein
MTRLGSGTPKSSRSPRRQRASRYRNSGHKRKQTLGSSEQAHGVPLPEGLHEAIEIERGNLSKAESLLGCLVTSMEYETDPVNAPYFPDVAQLARDLVRQSLNGLDSLSLQKYLMRNKVKEESALPIGRGCSIPAEYDSNGMSASPYGRWTAASDTYLSSAMLQ